MSVEQQQIANGNNHIAHSVSFRRREDQKRRKLEVMIKKSHRVKIVY